MTTPQSATICPVLTLRVSRCVCAVPLAHVAEVMRPLPVEPLAGAPAGVLGMAVIRGKATPVIDLSVLLGDRAAAATASARFVTIRAGQRAIALLVDAVLAIRTLARAELEALPPLWETSHPSAVSALGTLDRELLIVLEATHLLPEDWHHAGEEGAAG